MTTKPILNQTMAEPLTVETKEFDEEHPLVVKIEPNDNDNDKDEWDMNVAKVKFHLKPAINHQERMLERIAEAAKDGNVESGYEKFQDEWKKRPVVGGKTEPHFIKERGHHFP